MARNVKCYICGETFDRETIPCVQKGRRYAHLECDPDNKNIIEIIKKPKSSNQQIMDFLDKLYGDVGVNFPLIGKQIKQYEEQGYTESGILASLIYWYQILGHSITKDEEKNSTGGIGIVPYIYPRAREYFLKVAEAKQKNENKDYTIVNKTVKIKVPENNIKINNFFEDIERGENE